MARKNTEEWLSVKGYARKLLLAKVSEDPDKRPVGYTYNQVLVKLRRRFPKITYNGPHKGHPIRMNVKQLREIAYTMQSNDRTLRLPVRPRSDRKKSARKTRALPPATLALQRAG